MDPRTPQVAWDAANFYLAEGQTDRALKQFRTVVENDPENAKAAIELSFRATQDAELVLARTIPPRVANHLEFINILCQFRRTE